MAQADLPRMDTARLVRFAVSGGVSAGVFFLVSLSLTAAGLRLSAAALAAYATAFCVGYGLQRNWTFGAASRHRIALPRYFALQAACALATALLSEWIASAGADRLLALLAVTGFAGLASFVASSRWVFRPS